MLVGPEARGQRKEIRLALDVATVCTPLFSLEVSIPMIFLAENGEQTCTYTPIRPDGACSSSSESIAHRSAAGFPRS